MTHLLPSYDPVPLALSVVLALLSVFVLVEVAMRVRTSESGSANFWWAAGAVAVGTGLWASHFFGLHARKLPIPIGYSPVLTFVSWIAVVSVAALLLSLTRRKRTTRFQIVVGAIGVAAILATMVTTGLASIELAPGIDWNVLQAVAAMTLAIVFGAALIAGVSWSLGATGWPGRGRQSMTAIGLGLAYAGLHVVALAAANVPFDAVCYSANALDGDVVGNLTLVAATLLLACTQFGSIVYGFADRRRTQLAGSLESAEARLVSVNDELRQRAFLDSLTGLPNRLLLEDRLAHALKRTERAKKSVRGLQEKLAILFIDIDSFMPVNQSFGHAVGDEVLRQTADRIVIQARNSDTVARFSGDQFLVLMEGAGSMSDCLALSSRIIEAIKEPFHIGDRRIQITVSIGVVVYPDQGERDKLIANADTAMRAAKRAGRGTYALFEAHMEKDATEQLDLINDLRQAIELGQLALHYQPKIDGRRAVICGVEALLRWTHPTRGMVSPALFIPIAERFGFINALGNWVIDEACRQMEAWARSGVHMRVAINLSVHQLREVELVSRIEAAMERHNVQAHQLLCEITESVAMQDFNATQRTLDELGRIGVFLSIDDFGTGYSSLSYLRQLPARQLKIDRSFVNDLEQSSDARAVVDAVVRLAHALGLRVVAEGVETGAQRDILLRLGCDELQGYFFAQPMSADKLLDWTSGKKPKGSVDFARSLVAEGVVA